MRNVTSFIRDVFQLRLTISSGKGNVVKCTLRRNGKADVARGATNNMTVGLNRIHRARRTDRWCAGLVARTNPKANLANKFRGALHILLGGSFRATRKGLAWPPCVAHLLFLAQRSNFYSEFAPAHYAWDTTAGQSGPAYFSTGGAGLSKMAHSPS